MVKVKALKDSWEKRLELRADRKALQASQQALTDEIIAEKRVRSPPEQRCAAFSHRYSSLTAACATAQAARAAREEKAKRKEENKKKGQQYQVISNVKKIKKMSKKQLRMLSKADTTGVAPKVYPKGTPQ